MWTSRLAANSRAARQWQPGGANERNVLHHFPDGDRYVIEGIDKVETNAKVCTEVESESFCRCL